MHTIVTCIDPQTLPVLGHCPFCGAALYHLPLWRERCPRCRVRDPGKEEARDEE